MHAWAPSAEKKWYLITSIDDHSRRMLYGDLWEKESSWAHISAVKSLVLGFGCPLKYYVDNHSIFRFIEERDSMLKKLTAKEEDVQIQWKEVLKDLGIEVVYALSPAAKGKIERPYRWIQDHLVRTCSREGITQIEQARQVLHTELNQYNFYRVHSTTKEVPATRFEKTLREKKTLFRPFQIPKPYEKEEDIFCYREKRIVNPYRRISFHNLQMAISGVPIREEVELRMSFDPKSKLATIRFWHKSKLVGQQQVKAQDLKTVHF